MQRNSDQDSGAGVEREEMLPRNTTKVPTHQKAHRTSV